MKYLVLLAVVLAVFWLLRKSFKKKSSAESQKPKAHDGEDMVRCAQCGVYLPRSDSLMSAKAFYCSVEHRRLREPAD